jgi:hypothetical protein
MQGGWEDAQNGSVERSVVCVRVCASEASGLATKGHQARRLTKPSRISRRGLFALLSCARRKNDERGRAQGARSGEDGQKQGRKRTQDERQGELAEERGEICFNAEGGRSVGQSAATLEWPPAAVARRRRSPRWRSSMRGAARSQSVRSGTLA